MTLCVYGVIKDGVEYAVAHQVSHEAWNLLPKLTPRQYAKQGFTITNWFDPRYEDVFDHPGIVFRRRGHNGEWLWLVPACEAVTDTRDDASPCDVEAM